MLDKHHKHLTVIVPQTRNYVPSTSLSRSAGLSGLDMGSPSGKLLTGTTAAEVSLTAAAPGSAVSLSTAKLPSGGSGVSVLSEISSRSSSIGLALGSRQAVGTTGVGATGVAVCASETAAGLLALSVSGLGSVTKGSGGTGVGVLVGGMGDSAFSLSTSPSSGPDPTQV